MINQKLTPIFLTDQGKIWKALCIVSFSNEQDSGNIKIQKQGSDKVLKYDLVHGFWKEEKKIELSKREKEILQLSIRGYTISEIAEIIYISPDTVKFHRRKLFGKLNVSNITEAISFAINNKLI